MVTPSYEECRQSFDWSQSARELGYEDGQPINIGWYCSDRICEQGLGQKPALIWEDNGGREATFTFDDIRDRSDAIAAHLASLGIERGERVCIFMDRLPELYIGFLGVLKLGAVVQPLFSAFGEESLGVRLENAETCCVITQMKHVRKVRRARKTMPFLRHVIVVDGQGKDLKEGESAMTMTELEHPADFRCAETGPEDFSVLHYTSGTTGQPKGAQHVHSSLISQYITAKWVLDLRPDDIYWCNADPGWVTGTSYGIIGPWANGITQVVLDAGFNSDAWYAFMARHEVTVWYSAPTAIRLLMRDGTELVKKHDLSSLRHLCSVGEPLNAEAVIWSEEAFGKPFHDTYWQTETGCMVITNWPGMKVKPGSMGKPFPGIEAAVVDPKTGEAITEPGKVGIIALAPGWPSMIRGYRNNQAGWDKKFLNGWYLCGDQGSIDQDGYFWFSGRDDDVINTGGHLVGPFEIESALLEHEAVAESAAVATPDTVNMEVVKAFVVLKPGFEPSDDLDLAIMNFIRKKLSPLAMPQQIEFIDQLPKTRSGKIIRRILRAQEFGEDIGDVSTLMNDDD
ncbi:acetate--CoA ligase [bacterium]|nr:acetate--CoA ligase [bacterium]